LKLLRDAFEKISKDPAYLADAEKRKLEIDFETGAELEASAKEVIAATPEVIERMKKLLGN
jgi:tripartite-type tricarboxylate transporter receptor subunit TctC